MKWKWPWSKDTTTANTDTPKVAKWYSYLDVYLTSGKTLSYRGCTEAPADQEFKLETHNNDMHKLYEWFREGSTPIHELTLSNGKVCFHRNKIAGMQIKWSLE